MGAHTRDAFVADVEGFLRDNVLKVIGGWQSQTKSAVGNVRSAAGNPAFALGARRTGVELVAPELEAYFEKETAATEPHIFPFSKPQVVVRLDAPGTNAKSLAPVYLIPYAGGSGHGVRLPSQATDGYLVAYAMTAAQQGCTVEVSGDATSPHASHTNVIDAAAAQRQTVLNQRVAELQNDFLLAEHAAGLAPAAPNPAAANRAWFSHYAATGGNPVAEHNYSAISHGVIQPQLQPGGAITTIKSAHRLDRGRKGHSNYRYRVAAIAIALNPAAPSQGQVVAERTGGNWTFYYQVWNPIPFDVVRKDKLGLITYRRDRRRVTLDVVLAWGQLWPAYTQNVVHF